MSCNVHRCIFFSSFRERRTPFFSFTQYHFKLKHDSSISTSDTETQEPSPATEKFLKQLRRNWNIIVVIEIISQLSSNMNVYV
jgi:hypothetical protein